LIKKYKILNFLWVIITLITSCDSAQKEDKSQGIIHYKLTYLDSERENPIITLLPTTMDVKFKQQYLSNTLAGDMGLFTIRFIINGIEKTNTTLIAILGEKYSYTAPMTDEIPGFEKVFDLKLVNTHESTKYRQFFAKETTINYKNKADKQVTKKIVFSDSLHINYASYFTPFKKIDGLLLQFETQFSGINMRFEVDNIEYTPVPDTEFKIPDKYKAVDKNGMLKVMNKYLPQK